MEPSTTTHAGAVLLFDGDCSFCNGTVQFVAERDPRGYFNFAPLQSNHGRASLRPFAVDAGRDAVILIEAGKVYLGSDAAVRVARRLSGAWPLLSLLLRGLPRGVREWAYAWFARHRYAWFGAARACHLPTPALRARLLNHDAAPPLRTP